MDVIKNLEIPFDKFNSISYFKPGGSDIWEHIFHFYHVWEFQQEKSPLESHWSLLQIDRWYLLSLDNKINQIKQTLYWVHRLWRPCVPTQKLILKVVLSYTYLPKYLQCGSFHFLVLLISNIVNAVCETFTLCEPPLGTTHHRIMESLCVEVGKSNWQYSNPLLWQVKLHFHFC